MNKTVFKSKCKINNIGVTNYALGFEKNNITIYGNSFKGQTQTSIFTALQACGYDCNGGEEEILCPIVDIANNRRDTYKLAKT